MDLSIFDLSKKKKKKKKKKEDDVAADAAGGDAGDLEDGGAKRMKAEGYPYETLLDRIQVRNPLCLLRCTPSVCPLCPRVCVCVVVLDVKHGQGCDRAVRMVTNYLC